MRPGQIVFTVVSLLIAGLALLTLLSTWFVMLPKVAAGELGFWHFMVTYLGIIVLMLGGGGIANFAKGRLAAWPTGIMIAGYCFSLWLLPLAVWGIFALLAERKRQNSMAEKT